MATTSQLAETLIIGLQTLLWISLLVLALSSGPANNLTTPLDLTNLEKFSSLLALFVIAVSYFLGIVFERISSYLAHRLDDLFPEREYGDASLSYIWMRLRIMKEVPVHGPALG